jgi:hypothetical protein
MRNPEVRASLVRRSIGALVAAGLAASACYRYVPVPITSAASQEVRIEVTPTAARRLAGDLGVFSTEIDGRLAPERHDSVSVHVPIDREYRGMTVGTTDQVLFLGRSEIVEVRRREFSRARTGLVAAGAVVGFGALAAGIVQLFDPNQPSDQTLTPPPPPQGSRRPSGVHLRIRIPIS